MKKLIFLAIFCLWAIGSNAKVINGLASINDLEKVGVSSGKRSISGGTVIVDNEAGTFGLAYEDYWGSTPAYKIYEKVRVGDSGYFDLGRGCVGSTNPVFDSYESGPQSDGAVFSIKANKDGWMTVFTKIMVNIPI